LRLPLIPVTIRVLMIPFAPLVMVLFAIAALGASRQSGLTLPVTLPAVLLGPVLGSR
jgi:hypothetical protein